MQKDASNKLERNMDILKAVVGSVAHGLNTPESDIDYAGVFATSTSELLSIDHIPDERRRVGETEDNVEYEIGKFLHLAVKSNLTILEVFMSPIEYVHPRYGWALLDLFPYVWSSKGVKSAAFGYSRDQYNRLIKNTDTRGRKYAATAIRVLYQAHQILSTGSFDVRVVDSPIGQTLVNYKQGWFSTEEFVTMREYWENKVVEAYSANPDKKSDIGMVNDFLLWLRKENW